MTTSKYKESENKSEIKNKNKDESNKKSVETDYTNRVCLNCGTKLQGEYCHKCGQANFQHQSKIKNFILEYLSNAFILDPKLIPTLWTLIRKPGHLTNEFMAGRYVSYEHPIKLNMFLLLVFVTIFLFFSNTEKMNNTLTYLKNQETILPAVVITTLENDEEYKEKIKKSDSDTIKLIFPRYNIEDIKKFTIIKPIQNLSHNLEAEIDTILAITPQILIKDKFIVADQSGTYRFADENNIINESKEFYIINNIWQNILRIITQYFPLIILLTVPFLSIAVGFVHRQKKKAPIKHFVFSLHYTAFVELMLILIYILYLIAKPASHFMELFMLITTYIYLTLSIKTAYRNSWSRSLIKSLIISFTYIGITLVTLIVILMIAIIIVGASLSSETSI